MSVEYRDEAERVSREWSMARVDEVRTALTSTDLDEGATSRRLGYDVSGPHVALVLVRTGDDPVTLEATMRELAATVANVRPLVAMVDSRTAWCWIPTNSVRRATLTMSGVVCGQGRPRSGLEGFRVSHHEALDSVRVARLQPTDRPTVTHFEDVQLLSVCSQDAEALSRFVTSVLADLAAPSTLAHRLRTTLGAFYAANCNYRAAAARLDLHHNTVRYRLTQAEHMMGRTHDDRRLETELALHLAAHLGLTPDA
jgi:sugar diacid utilization regulator